MNLFKKKNSQMMHSGKTRQMRELGNASFEAEKSQKDAF